MRARDLLVIGAAALSWTACTKDPVYVAAPDQIQVPPATPIDPNNPNLAMASLDLPYDLAYLTEDPDYQRDRADRLDAINAELTAAGDAALADDQYPLVRLDQLEIEIEWSIENLSDPPGQARIYVNGANQYFSYVPANFIVPAPPGAEQDPPPPPLSGDVPIDVPANGQLEGVFREDQLREAAIDLELITRGGINPFAALLSVHEDIENVLDVPYVPVDPDNPMPPTLSLPIEAFASFVRFDIGFEADQPMVLTYAVRVRETEPLLHDELLDAPANELMAFMPVEYVPPSLPAP